jgi:two-component system sensor histidine kinase/response regulator
MEDRPKILIVDDRKENLIALRTILSELDAELVEATNGNDALAATLNNTFALAILDVQMPGMDGYELAEYMHGDPTTNKVPVIFLTANYSGEDKISRGYERGAVDYLIKPYDPFILLSKVGVFLKLYQQSVELKKYSDHLEKLVLERTSKLDSAVEDLKRSNMELEQFTTIAAHDLQEPLRRVTSYSQLLKKKYREKIDAEADEIIDFVVDGARNLQEMILDLHDFVEVNSKNIQLSKIDLSQILKKSIKQLEKAINETKCSIESDSLPLVKGNEQLLTRLFYNLLDNSIKFRGSNPPKIDVKSIEFDDHWRIIMSDNGIGIDPQYYDMVFQIFKTLHPKHKYPGRGIGLPIAKRIVERQNGKIWIESEPEKGTSVIFTLMKNN